MPTLIRLALPVDLLARLDAYAAREGLRRQEAAIALLTAGLARDDWRAAQSAGGKARHAGRTPAQRSALAAHAASVREIKRQLSRRPLDG